MKAYFIKYGIRDVKIFYEPLPDNPNILRVERTSDTTGKINTLDLPITEDQLRRWLTTTALIQNVMPHLDSTQREFLISGCSSEEWDSLTKGKVPL